MDSPFKTLKQTSEKKLARAINGSAEPEAKATAIVFLFAYQHMHSTCLKPWGQRYIVQNVKKQRRQNSPLLHQVVIQPTL